MAVMMVRVYLINQKGNAMTFDAYCEWRNTRDLRVQGQAGFTAKRKQQRRTRCRQMHSCLGLLCRVSIIWSVRAREVSEDRLPGECFYAGLSSSFSAALHLLIDIVWCNLFGS
jgi:hypothetical protein